MATEEEQRALDWQAQQKRREAFERSLQEKLRPQTNADSTVKKNWDPQIRR